MIQRHLAGQLRTRRGRPAALTLLGLGVAAVWLLLVSLLAAATMSPNGARLVQTAGQPYLPQSTASSTTAAAGKPGATTNAPGTATSTPTTTTPSTSSSTAPSASGSSAGAATAEDPPGSTAPGTTIVPGIANAALPAGGDTTGVTDTTIRIGIHAPETVGGAPLNLAADPIKGIRTYAQYINDHGGIFGRKLVLDIQDDGANAESARNAAATMIDDHKDFVVSGTLGIDQIAIVAAEAYKRGVPYLAGGGNESKPIPGMFQLTASYQTMVHQLADYMKTDPNLRGKRVGILVSTSEYIRPAADDFKRDLEADGFTVSTIVNAQGPTENPDYGGYVLQLRQSNTQVVVPLTDPVTTAQVVQRCVAGAACGWTYSFVDFANDWDLALTLMAPTWENQHVRGLSTGCYYMAPQINDPAQCGALAKARDEFVAINGQGAWNTEGSGAAFGYQVISMIKGALEACGRNLTRQRFEAALHDYQNYSDLVTGPITFAGSTNTMHGATEMTVYEAESNSKYRMVSAGLQGSF